MGGGATGVYARTTVPPVALLRTPAGRLAVLVLFLVLGLAELVVLGVVGGGW